MKKEQLADAVLRLAPKDRAALAQRLWESLGDPDCAPGDMPESQVLQWAQKRDEELSSGQIKPLAHKDLMTRLRRER